mgnify:CR=1 FL=1
MDSLPLAKRIIALRPLLLQLSLIPFKYAMPTPSYETLTEISNALTDALFFYGKQRFFDILERSDEHEMAILCLQK